MNTFLTEILPYLVAVLTTAPAGFLVGRKAKQSADKKAAAEAKLSELENDEKAAKIMQDYIVGPLQNEMKKLRRSMTKLERAIERTTDCEYRDNCPVRRELQKQEENE
jgi:hypothetical protein